MLTPHILVHLNRLGYQTTIEQTPDGYRGWATSPTDQQCVEVVGHGEDARYRCAVKLPLACGVDLE